MIAVTRTVEGGVGGGHRHAHPEVGCPACGVVTSRVHQRSAQWVRDLSFERLVDVVVGQQRWRFVEPLCGRETFAEHADQVPSYIPLKERVVAALAAACPPTRPRWGCPGRPRCAS